MAPRRIGWLVAVAAATVIAGCGGDEDGGFADVANQTCEEVTAAAETLRTDLVRGPGNDETAAVKAAVDRYATAVRAAADRLREAHPTKADRPFQQQAVSYLRAQAAAVRKAADGERPRAAQAATAPLIPPAVLDGAPACESAAR